jgi:DNA (cytosine-5)-methyltransferase 3A
VDEVKVLSLFDGMSCGLEALKQVNIPVTEYHAFEIDKYAIKIAKKNHPEIIHHGDVKTANWTQFEGFDLVIAGSPCQGFSFAGKQLAFDDPRSKLFFEFVKALEVVKPRFFMLENVKMKREYLDVITKMLGVEPVLINSALVSAQNRQRYYWANWPISHPEDMGILLKDILHEHCEPEYAMGEGWCKWWKENADFQINKKYSQLDGDKAITQTARQYASWNGNYTYEWLSQYIVPFDKTLQILEKEVERGKVGYFGTDSQSRRVYYIHDKAVTLCGDAGGGAAKMGQYLFGCITPEIINKNQNGQRFNDGQKFYTLTKRDKHGVFIEGYIRKLTPVECERLQTMPDNYTEGVSDSQRYKMLGNGWNLETIKHNFNELKKWAL